MPTPILQVIIASTRPGRVGKTVADYIVGYLAERDQFRIEVVDLLERNLPLMDEPNHPRMHRYTHEHTKAWSATISRGDAFLLVMPEYNYSFTAPLKNALDYLSVEWRGKPVALASYGGISGGLRGATALNPVLNALGLRLAPAAIAIPWVGSHIENGQFVGYDALDQSIDAVYDSLVELQAASARERD